LASFTVTSGKCVEYDGRLKYGGNGITYTVNDTRENYLNSLADVSAGNITIVTDFNNVISAEEGYISKTVDFSLPAAKGTGTHSVFDVTGLVRMKVVPVCTTTLVASANTATICLGTADNSSGWIGGTSTNIIAAGDIWFDSSPTKTNAGYASAVFDKLVFSQAVGYEVATNSMSTGAITFHCWFTPMDATGNVTAGNLSTMT
jgi:hypothetical protein